MSLVGNLEDLGLGDILQIVSLSRKSGVLNLSWAGVEGKIIFRDGQVVSASSTERKSSLDSILNARGVISSDKVEIIGRTLDSLADAKDVKEVLSREFGIGADSIEDSIRQHIESTVFQFFTWPEGTFSFELQEIDSELAALKPPDHAFVLGVGLSPQFLAMEGTRLQDEQKKTASEAPVAPRAPSPVSGSPAAIQPPAKNTEPYVNLERGPEPASPSTGQEFGSVSEALAFYEAAEKRGEASGMNSAPAPNRSETASVAPAPVQGSGGEALPGTAMVSEKRPAPPPEPGLAAPGSCLMVVDDENLVLESLNHHLSGKGYQLKTFSEVSRALAYLQEQVDMGDRPAAAIYDLLMPDSTNTSTLGGLEMLEETRKISPAIPVYMMSDYENLPGREKSLELGARFFFMKPKTSLLEEDMHTPELINFISVLENALQSEPKTPPSPLQAVKNDMINLGEELRREFGEEVRPVESRAEPVTPSRGLPMLKAMISELNDPGASGQITLLILRFAAELMNRAVIFLVAKKQLAGLGQFGIDLDGADALKHVRQVRIPLNAPSIFREAIQKRMPLKKALKKTKWNEYLVQSLGGKMPKEVFVAPIIAGGKIPAILYGDNIPEDREIGDTESLEIFLAQAGLAMEKALLERKLREIGRHPED